MNQRKKPVPKIQKKVADLYRQNNWKTDPTLLILAMQEELGELAARWLVEHPGYEKSVGNTDPIPEEVGDLINLILAFCNTQGINFEECVENTIAKRKNRK